MLCQVDEIPDDNLMLLYQREELLYDRHLSQTARLGLQNPLCPPGNGYTGISPSDHVGVQAPGTVSDQVAPVTSWARDNSHKQCALFNCAIAYESLS